MRGWVAFSVAVGCLVPQIVLAQDKGKGKGVELGQIFADWKHRQGLLKSARYVVTGTTEYKDPELPTGNPVRPRKSVLQLDLVKNRYWLETSEEVIHAGFGNGKEFVLRVKTGAYDGKIGQGYVHRDLNRLGEDGPDLIISKARATGNWFDTHLWPVLYAHGLVPTVHTHVQLDKMPPSHDSDDFEVRGRQTIRGHRYTVVRTDPRAGMSPIHDEFWIDSSQQSAIHRYVHFSGSNPSNRLDVEWKKTEYGWWPDKWTLTWTMNGKVRRIQRLAIESFEPNPAVADADFTLPAKPGMKVSVLEPVPSDSGLDPNFPATKTYLVLPSGAWQEVDAKGFTTLAGKVLPPERGRVWVWWTSAAAAVLTTGIAYYYLRRKRSEAAA